MSRVRYKTTKGTIVFRVIFLVLLAAAVTAIAVLCNWLWRFLDSYEISQTYHVVEALTVELKNGNYQRLFNETEMTFSPYETAEDYKTAAENKIHGEITYSKSAKESKPDNPVYVLKSDGEGFAYASLVKTGNKTEFGFDMYKLDSIYGLEVEKNEHVTISVPDSCNIYVNHIGVTSVPDKTEGFSETEYFVGFLENEPKMNTYTIDGLINAPTVIVTDENGNELATDYNADSKTYSCALEIKDAAAAKEAEAQALEFSHLYTEYIANDISFNTLAAHMNADTELYADMSTYEGKYAAWHSAYKFSGDEVVSVTQYSDSCFAVRVKYTHTITFGGEDYDYPNDNTIYLVKNGDLWTAVNIFMN